MREALTIGVRVTPRGARDAIVGVDEDGVLHVRVRAAPVDGAANTGVRRLLARELGRPPSDVDVVRGSTARRKLVRLGGVDASLVTARWPGIRLGTG